MNRFKEIRIDSETCQACADNVTGHRTGICDKCRTANCVKCRKPFVLNYVLESGKVYVCKKCRGANGKEKE
jgi:hypothetical protein